jgi:nucleoside-diphosphate-sugar epimerase
VTRAAVVLGATGRLGPAVVAALASPGRRVIRAGRSDTEIAGFDALDASWQQPDRWRAALHAVGCAPSDVTAVVNLVAADAEAVGTGAVRATAALAGLAGTPASIHIGSVSEFRRGRPSAYAAGKIAARTAARTSQLGVVLTLGVVPRPVGDPHDALVRWFATRIPAMAALPIDVSTPDEVGAAVVRVVEFDWAGLGCGRPAEVTLAGTTRMLGEVVGAAPSPHWYSGLLVRALARLPRTRGVRWARIVSLARQATGSSPSHYLNRPPLDAGVAGTAGGWRLLRYAEPPQLWLVPRVSSEVAR